MKLSSASALLTGVLAATAIGCAGRTPREPAGDPVAHRPPRPTADSAPTTVVFNQGSPEVRASLVITPLGDGLWLHTSLDPVSGFPSNGLLLETGSESVLFDTAWNDEQTGGILHWAATELRKPVRRAIITHAHNDRLGGIGALRAAGVRATALGETVRLATKESSILPDSIPGLTSTPITDAAGFELFYPGPGHSPDNIVVYLPSHRTLFGGCLVKSDTATTVGNVADADVAEWPRAVARVRERYPDVHTVIPGHGKPSGPAALPVTETLIAEKGPAAVEALRRRAVRPPIGIIDHFGVRSVSEARVLDALGMRVGDSLTTVKLDAALQRLRALPGVADASLDAVCCEAGRTIVYVGITEPGTPRLELRPEPRGDTRLPTDITRAGADLDSALMDAVRRGVTGDDWEAGHSLTRDSAARAVQERFVGFATRSLPTLRDVLRFSSIAEHRALAAQVMAYAPDKRDVVPDLVEATRDPNSGVRNDATRALVVIADLAQRRPELGIRVPAEPFIAMVGSPVWSDRNKSSMALMQLTQRRDPALLAALRERALTDLADMARWKSPGHAMPAFFILGRIAGLSDEQVFAAFDGDDRERVIRAAVTAGPGRRIVR